jgi:hypothetical protein
MGFVYKLTPQISAFIIDQKRSEPKVTCQAISGMIFSRFGQQVSKSSVHFLLKQSHVIVPRARKVKEKFEIPSHKKEEISKALAPFVSMGSAQNPVSERRGEASSPLIGLGNPAPTIKPEFGNRGALPAGRQVSPIKTVGDVFLKCALYDLSFKPILGMKEHESIASQEVNKFEWGYLTGLVYSIRIQLQDESVFYLDPRFQGFHEKENKAQELAAPIERVAWESADYILNNIKPLIIRECDATLLNSCLYSFIACMNNEEGKIIKNISLIDQEGKTLSEFSHPLIRQRGFIIAIVNKVEQFQWFMETSDLTSQWQGLRVLKLNDKIIITNLYQKTYEEIIQLFLNRHPGNSLQILSPQFKNNTHQPQGLKARLQERARMFFSSDLTQETLEKILELRGFEEIIVDDKKETVAIHTHLQVNGQGPFLSQIQQATDKINSLNIVNYQIKKIILSVDVSSD